MFSNLTESELPGGLLKQGWGSFSVSDSGGLCMRICISKRFTDDAEVASPGLHFGNNSFKQF